MIITKYNKVNLELLQSVISREFFKTSLTRLDDTMDTVTVGVKKIHNTDPELSSVILEDGNVLTISSLKSTDYFTVDAEEEFVMLVETQDHPGVYRYIKANLIKLDVNSEHKYIGKYLETHSEVLPNLAGVYCYLNEDSHLMSMDRDDFEDVRPARGGVKWHNGRRDIHEVYVTKSTMDAIATAMKSHDEELILEASEVMALRYQYRIGDVVKTPSGPGIVADITGSYDLDSDGGERVSRRASELLVVCGSRYTVVKVMDLILNNK